MLASTNALSTGAQHFQRVKAVAYAIAGSGMLACGLKADA